jgi:hypothetical protein
MIVTFPSRTAETNASDWTMVAMVFNEEHGLAF